MSIDVEAHASELGFSPDLVALAKKLADVTETPSDGIMQGWFGWLDDAQEIADQFEDWDFDEFTVSINPADHIDGALLILRVNDMVFIWAQGRSVDGHVEISSVVVK